MKNLKLKLHILLVLFSIMTGSLLSQTNKIEFFKDTLPNGLQVIYHLDNSAPVVALVTHYKAGCKDEFPDKTGYAHFFEHLMFEATRDIPRATIDKYINEAGGDLNAHTSYDETVFYFRLPSNEIKLGLWIEAQRMRMLKVDTIGVETQRGVVQEEKKMRGDNTPYGSLMEKMTSRCFNGGTYSWEPIGNEKHLQKAKIEDFKQFYDIFYQPNNATLVIAGDFDLDSAMQYVKDYFGNYPKAEEPKRQPVKLNLIQQEYREDIIDNKAQLPGVFIGYNGPGLSDSSHYAMNVLTNIMASGQSSRLYRRLVDDEQLAAECSVIPEFLQHSGLIIFYAIAAPGKDITKSEKIIYEEINKIIKEGIKEEELNKARNIIETQFVEQKKSVLDKAMSLASMNSYFGKPELINTEINNYLRLTTEDIRKAAMQFLNGNKRVVLTYYPANYKK